MSKIIVGKAGGKNVGLDLDVLLRTRLLVQSNSGGGKSFLLRRLLEQAFGRIQCIAIDPAGEFSTLREKFDYILVGQGGETPADIRSAALVATKLLELRVSAVCDLYGMKPHERHTWLHRFLEAVMNAPKKLWHPVLFVVDEAHKFAPEKGEGESEAKPEMLSLASDGRKYGFCAVFATQRLSKLDKSAAAELLNVLIGPTFMDLDLERAHKALGIVRADWKEFDLQMKTIEPGHFWALGRAISTQRLLVHVGPVETTHPESGSAKHAAEPPPPSAKVKALLPKLKDLPQAAEEKAKTESDLRAEIRSLKQQLRAQPKAAGPVGRAGVHPLPPRIEKIIENRAIEAAVKKLDAQRRRELAERDGALKKLSAALAAIAKQAAGAAGVKLSAIKEVPVELPKVRSGPAAEAPARPAPVSRSTREVRSNPEALDGLKKGAVAMLRVLAQWEPDQRTRDQLGALTGFTPSGGTFGEYLRVLRLAGYIAEQGDDVSITPEGLAAIGPVDPRPDSPAGLIALWKSKFKAGVGKMLDVLVESGEWMTREELGEHSGFTAGAGTFGEYLRCLRTARLIEERGQDVRIGEVLR